MESRPVTLEQKVRVCLCHYPRPWTDPRKHGWCVACLGKLPGLSDDDMRAFYREVRDMLETTGHGDAGEPFSVQALTRHEAGKTKFPWRWMGRENSTEGTEEEADAGNYAAYETIRGKRMVDLLGADESDVEAARVEFLEAAYFSALAHEAFRRGRAKLRDSLE